MNDDFDDLERELRRLQPSAASERLAGQLAEVFDSPTAGVSRRHSPWWQRLGFNRPLAALGWGFLSPAAAAGVALIVAGQTRAGWLLPCPLASPGPTTHELANKDGEPLREAKAVNVFYQTLDDGIVMNGSQEPVRRVRYRSADRVRWHNPQSGSQWEVSYPREDVLLIPVEAE